MTQQADIKKLEKYALDKEITFYSTSNEKYFLSKRFESYRSARYVIYDLQELVHGVYFIFFDSSTGFKRSAGCSYSGLFKEIKQCNNTVTISRRDWLDRLSFKRRYLTDNKLLNDAITIRSDTNRIDGAILTNKRIENYISLSNDIEFLFLKTEVKAMNVLPRFNEKNLISLTTTNWVVDFKILDLFISKGCDLLKEL